jgi:hypothetical protein
MHFLCFATGNKRSRVDQMPTYPLEQNVIKSNVLKKGKVVSKYTTLQRMSLKTSEGSLEIWFMSLCNMQFNVGKEKSPGDSMSWWLKIKLYAMLQSLKFIFLKIISNWNTITGWFNMHFNTIKEKWLVDLILMAQNKTSCDANW